jgi:hypothetical protein
MGSVKIGTTSYFMSGSSLNPTQAVEAPDVVGGHYMKRGWVYGKVDITGNVTGPLHENATDLWTTAFARTPEGDHLSNTVAVEIAFYKGGGWKFGKVVINSLQIAATAGEVVNFTADFAGKKADSGSAVESLTAASPVTCAKLMTWDRAKFSVTGLAAMNMQSITFTLNNNVQKAYTITSSIDTTQGLYPVDLPCGVREITGTLSVYAEGPINNAGGGIGKAGANVWTDYVAETANQQVNFSVEGASGNIIDTNFKAVFHRPEGAGQTGLAIYTINFTGVCDAT